MNGDRLLGILARVLRRSETEVKRWIVWNIVIEPVTALLYIPYNLFVIGYSPHQFVRWALTGAEYGLLVNFIIQMVATLVVRYNDRHFPRRKEVREEVPEVQLLEQRRGRP